MTIASAPSPAAARLSTIVPHLRRAVAEAKLRPVKGRVQRILGLIIHATVPGVHVGELCQLNDPMTGRSVLAEVIGLSDDRAILTPIGNLDGLSSLTEVIPTGHDLRVRVGEGLLGRVVSALGEPLDGEPLTAFDAPRLVSVQAPPPAPLKRALADTAIQLGVKALGGLITCARGQRLGIFGAPGVGKSSLLARIVRGTDADVIVVALIGERGREVREFIGRHLGPEGRARAVTVVATSDRPAMERTKAAYVATAIAEYFRDRGKNVLLVMDSVTRFARAQREIGLAAGEPPTRRGFPPSLFAALPQLLERAGTDPTGSLTAIYTVLVEGEDEADPVAEEVRAILDGHIVLTRELAERNHFPAIDVLRSRSRLMDAVISDEHKQLAGHIRGLLARYAEVELLLRVGEYSSGSDPKADEAVSKIDRINAFLQQRAGEHVPMTETLATMRELVA